MSLGELRALPPFPDLPQDGGLLLRVLGEVKKRHALPCGQLPRITAGSLRGESTPLPALGVKVCVIIELSKSGAPSGQAGLAQQ